MSDPSTSQQQPPLPAPTEAAPSPAAPTADATSNAERKARKDAKRAAKAQAQAARATATATAATGSSSTLDADAEPAKKAPHRNDPRSQPVDVQLSKALAYILRHGALKEGLEIRPDGFIRLDDVLARPRLKSLNMAQPGAAKAKRPDLDDVRKIVEDNDKKRFEIAQHDGTWLIRAVQGHSLKEVTALSHVELTLDNLHLLRPNVPFPASSSDGDEALESRLAATQLEPGQSQGGSDDGEVLVIHGTDAAAWDRIRQSGGLRPMTRNHIHLAKGKLGDEGVISGMRKSASRLVFVDIRAALRDGIPFFLSSNGVVLTPGKVPEGTPQQAVVPSATEASAEEQQDSAKGANQGGQGRRGGGGARREGEGESEGGKGQLPLGYIVRVEDAKGQVVWTP